MYIDYINIAVSTVNRHLINILTYINSVLTDKIVQVDNQ